MESEPPSPFYSEDFKESADYFLEQIGMKQEDIAPSTCKDVYIYLMDKYTTTS